MAGRRSPVTDIRELLRRLQLGEPDRRIARDLGLSRNTVARYREWAKDQGLLQAVLPEPAVLATLLQPAPTERPAQEQSLVEPFREQRFDRLLCHQRAQRQLNRVIEMAPPVLHFVDGFERIGHLHRNRNADLEPDVISTQNFLTGDGKGLFAQVSRCERVTKAPANVMTRIQPGLEFSMPIKPPELKFLDRERVAEAARPH